MSTLLVAKPLAVNTSDYSDIRQDSEFLALRQLSATIGSDSSLVQGAGGNTSIKTGDVLWIKASGKWLQAAQREDLFVPVALEPLLDAVTKELDSAEKSVDFVIESLNPSGLRPSIETTVHALLPHRIVVHVHCVETLALAIREDAETLLQERLSDFAWSWIPYVRPGLPLARMIQSHRHPDSDVLILGNHGLVVAADSVDAAALLLNQVCTALQCPVREAPPARLPALATVLQGSKYRLPALPRSHAVACDPLATQIASQGSLYPDHVIFLGEGSVVAMPDESANDVVDRLAHANIPAPVSILFPGLGVVMREDASPGQEAMAQCLSDVCLRIPEREAVNHLSRADNHALLNWEAEHYRQTLEQSNANSDVADD